MIPTTKKLRFAQAFPGWVLTLPYRLRYRLAWDHALCRAVLGVYARGLLAFYARTARAHGIPEGQTGTVTVIQRFGSGLQLNVHLHTLLAERGTARPVFASRTYPSCRGVPMDGRCC